MQLEKMIDCALGNKKAELVIKNAKIVDVFNGRIINGDAAICDGRIAGVGSYEGRRGVSDAGVYRRARTYRVVDADAVALCAGGAAEGDNLGCVRSA